jgi:hypothetical protein
MARATVIVEVDQPEQMTAVDTWFAKWGERLNFRSENQGCGCCVNIWEVEGPAEAFAELPPETCSDRG